MHTNSCLYFASIRIYSRLRTQTGPCAAMTRQRFVRSLWSIAGGSVSVHSRLFMVWPIRRLVTADGAAFRTLRLEALQTYPDAFGSTYEEEVTRPLSSFIQQLEKNVILGGFDHGELAGMIGFYRQSGPKDRHKGVIWGMYVKPRLHGGGLASALLDSAIELGKTQVEQIQLTVVTTNQRAVRLYEASGFRGYGIEKNALKSGERYFDELLMVRFFT